jgi:hypothetical protein
MATLLHSPELQFCDADGNPYAGGTINTYVVSTTTPKTTWTDSEETVANTNPIILDAAGRAIIYGDGLYRLILKDAAGNTVWDQPSSTLVSDAMAPVVIAPTLEDARDAMGITDAIQVEIDRALAAEAALQAAIDAEATRAEGVENALDLALANETNARIAADANLQTQIDALAPTMTGVQGGVSMCDASGHRRVDFSVPFATSCDAVTASMRYSGYGSNTINIANIDKYGFDIWVTQAGSPIPKPFEPFFYIALGS